MLLQKKAGISISYRVPKGHSNIYFKQTSANAEKVNKSMQATKTKLTAAQSVCIYSAFACC